ncbi:MAG: proline dehydrogenase family protein [Vicinamibacterales bacterium]
MLASGLSTLFHLLARSKTLKKAASRYGASSASSIARRFIAGETIADAIDVARALEARGLRQTLDHLGEGAATLETAELAVREYLVIVDTIIKAGIERNLSLKLTQLGLDADRATTVDHLRKILEHADDFFIRIDMESSAYTDVTLDIFETLWGQGCRNIGVVLQAELFRTEKDLRRIVDLGARIRLVKGAYDEPGSIAYRKQDDVEAAFERYMKTLLIEGNYPAIATHDPMLIDSTRTFAAQHGIGNDRFEFQLLYGIRRDLAQKLVDDGYRVRLYVPFGREWYPYFMRRLAERPENVAFVLRGILGEKRNEL